MHPMYPLIATALLLQTPEPTTTVLPSKLAETLAAAARAMSDANLADMLASAEAALARTPRVAWDQRDPADSLYRAARRELNRSRYRDAITLFRRIHETYPRSNYAGDALYWEAFALYRIGDTQGLQQARERLRLQAESYRDAATARRDARVLLRRVQGELARRGDAAAAAAIAEEARQAALPPAPPAAVQPPQPPQAPQPPTPKPRGGRSGRSAGCPDDEDDVRTAALNAMQQMDAERALPILKSVLQRRDTVSACLRRRAIFLVSQKRSPETASILLDAARRDPDSEVREQAVYWLSSVKTDEAVAALDSILRTTQDAELQEKAVFALSQHRSERAAATLRAYAERSDAPFEIRKRVIVGLGQQRSDENTAFLRSLYPRLESPDLRETVFYAVAQRRSPENAQWLLEIAANQREDIEIRKKALFHAGQAGAPMAALAALYDGATDREMREQLIFVYSQRRDSVALDRLITIAKTDPDRELRKKAIFWIGQSRDPRAAQFLQELINQ